MGATSGSEISTASARHTGALHSLPVGERHPRRWAKWVLSGTLAAGLITAALIWHGNSANRIRFETVALERGSIQSVVTATGTLNAVVDVQVGSQVSGNLQALYADFNTKVTKGQLIALIDPEIFQAQVHQAEAVARAAHMAAVTAEAQVAKSEADLSTAVAGRKNAEAVSAKDHANAINAANQWHRADHLFKEGIVSTQDHDSAKAAYDAAEAQLAVDDALIDAAQHSAQSAQAQLRVAEAQLSSAQAQERQAQAALDQCRINLAHTRIVAPVDGTVISRNMNVGQTIAASFQVAPIFDIAQDLTKMQVDTNVDESDVGNVRAGQKAAFTVDAYPGTTFHGEVADVRKAPITQQNVVTYDAVITVANPDFKLFPGMTANVMILTARVDSTLKVPNAVLRLHPSAEILRQFHLAPSPPDRQDLYLARRQRLEAVTVTLGASDGKYTAITSDALKEGEHVVVRFITKAHGGAAPGAMPRGPRL